jgi:hypothetical protein
VWLAWLELGNVWLPSAVIFIHSFFRHGSAEVASKNSQCLVNFKFMPTAPLQF